MTQTLSPCVAANFLGALFEVNPEKILARWGIAPPSKRKLRYCRSCGAQLSDLHRSRRYCGACRLIPISCDFCGKVTYRHRKELIEYPSDQANPFRKGKGRRYLFCGKQCQGKWLANHYGWPKTRKWDYDKVLQMAQETGWGALRLSRALGIPKSSLSEILVKARIGKI